MDNMFFPLDLSEFRASNLALGKEALIENKKAMSKLLRESRERAKLDKCYHCKTPASGFCNSHSVPAFTLRNIARDGKVLFSNSILELPAFKDDKGVNEAGTFHLICRKCDGEIFQDYETPENWSSPPTMKMLAQIDLKNNLKHISKRLNELEMYQLMGKELGANPKFVQKKTEIARLDLQEFERWYGRAKAHANNPCNGDYYVGFYAKLPYVVPVAFQSSVALIFDLDGGIINNVFNENAGYKMSNLSVCVFPLEAESVVMFFTEKDNRHYRKFYRQLKKLEPLDQLSVINYIIFAFCEDYFLSPDLSGPVLNELLALAGKTGEMLSLKKPALQERIEAVRSTYDFEDRHTVPNILSSQFHL